MYVYLPETHRLRREIITDIKAGPWTRRTLHNNETLAMDRGTSVDAEGVPIV
ncbi:MAG: hypothetical protein Q9198_000477 [Flavoplaca austrocitrina]